MATPTQNAPTPTVEDAPVAESLFGAGVGAPETARRFDPLTAEKPTSEGRNRGLAYVGKDKRGIFLVHEVGRQTEAVALHAVVALVAGGVIPVADVVGGYKQMGQLDALKKALAQA